MRLILNKSQLNSAPENLLRQAGYAYFFDRNTGQESFVRRLNRGFYPRFHLYLERRGDQVILNLHLDQKQASYQGAHAHNAEYDGETVAVEITRLKEVAGRDLVVNALSAEPVPGILDKIRPKSLPSAPAEKIEKPSWWKFWQ